mmetsp:Transcript_30679/g.89174  ORF Transcript_30679/g.89174 Transcript_30679/m.89174 type:complete len:300 (-) Transcript_30679:114-1013(-)
MPRGGGGSGSGLGCFPTAVGPPRLARSLPPGWQPPSRPYSVVPGTWGLLGHGAARGQAPRSSESGRTQTLPRPCCGPLCPCGHHRPTIAIAGSGCRHRPAHGRGAFPPWRCLAGGAADSAILRPLRGRQGRLPATCTDATLPPLGLCSAPLGGHALFTQVLPASSHVWCRSRGSWRRCSCSDWDLLWNSQVARNKPDSRRQSGSGRRGVLVSCPPGWFGLDKSRPPSPVGLLSGPSRARSQHRTHRQPHFAHLWNCSDSPSHGVLNIIIKPPVAGRVSSSSCVGRTRGWHFQTPLHPGP